MNDLESLIQEANDLDFGPLWLAEVERAVNITMKGKYSNATHILSREDLVQDVILDKLLISGEQQKILDIANDVGHLRALMIRLVRNKIDELRERTYQRNIYDRVKQEFESRGVLLEKTSAFDVKKSLESIKGIQKMVSNLPLRRILGEEDRLSPLFSGENLAGMVDEILKEGLVVTQETIWEGLSALTLFLPRLSNKVVDQDLVTQMSLFGQPEEVAREMAITAQAGDFLDLMSQDSKECYAAVIQGFGKSMSELARALGLRNRQNAAKRRTEMVAEMSQIIENLALKEEDLFEILKKLSHILYPAADLRGIQL